MNNIKHVNVNSFLLPISKPETYLSDSLSGIPIEVIRIIGEYIIRVPQQFSSISLNGNAFLHMSHIESGHLVCSTKTHVIKLPLENPEKPEYFPLSHALIPLNYVSSVFGSVFYASRTNHSYRLDKKCAFPITEYPLPEQTYVHAAAINESFLAFAFSRGSYATIVAYSVNSPEELWREVLDYDFSSMRMVEDNTLVFVDERHIVAYNLVTKKRVETQINSTYYLMNRSAKKVICGDNMSVLCLIRGENSFLVDDRGVERFLAPDDKVFDASATEDTILILSRKPDIVTLTFLDCSISNQVIVQFNTIEHIFNCLLTDERAYFRTLSEILCIDFVKRKEEFNEILTLS